MVHHHHHPFSSPKLRGSSVRYQLTVCLVIPQFLIHDSPFLVRSSFTWSTISSLFSGAFLPLIYVVNIFDNPLSPILITCPNHLKLLLSSLSCTISNPKTFHISSFFILSFLVYCNMLCKYRIWYCLNSILIFGCHCPCFRSIHQGCIQ